MRKVATSCASLAGEQACDHVATDGAAFVWTQQDKLYACKLPCAAPGTTRPELLAVHDGVVYWADNQIGDDEARILACPSAGCAGAPKVLVKGEFEIAGLAVDATGIYFTQRGRESGDPDGVVKVCRDRVAGCGVGSEVLADEQPQPDQLTLDDRFVCFSARGDHVTAWSRSRRTSNRRGPSRRRPSPSCSTACPSASSC